jgi:hypothetical protein
MKNILGVIFHPTKNNKIKKSLLLLTVAFFVGGFFVVNLANAQEATPQTFYVNSGTGNNGNDCLSSDKPCKTIQGAVDKASDGDTILVGSGLYEENVSIQKEVKLMKTEDTVPQTSGAGSNEVIVMEINIGNSTKNVHIEGMRILKVTADPAGEGTVIKGNEIGYIHFGSETEGLIIEENVFDALLYGGESTAVGALYKNSEKNTEGDKVNIFRNNIVKNAEEGIGVVGNPVIENNNFKNNTYHIRSYEVSGFEKTDFENTLTENVFDRAVVIRFGDEHLYEMTLSAEGNGVDVEEIIYPAIFSSIQDAIDHASHGNIIEVGAGTYNVYDQSWNGTSAVSIPETKEGIVLAGAGSDLTILDAQHETSSTFEGGNHLTVIWNRANNVTFSGFTVKGGDHGIRNNGSVVKNVTFDDVVADSNLGGGFVFEGEEFETVTFKDSEAKNNSDFGIFFNGASTTGNIILRNTSANGNGHVGFSCQGTVANLDIQGGTFNDNTGGPTVIEFGKTNNYYGSGIELRNTVGTLKDVTVKNNGFGGPNIVYRNEGGAGILLKDGSKLPNDIIITNADILDNMNGVWIEDPDSTYNWGGAFIGNVKITNSKIVGNQEFGVRNYEEDVIVDAKLNWWGHSDGPVVVQERVLFDPWWINEGMTADSNYVPRTGGPLRINPPSGGGETEGEELGEEDETEGEVLGETDSRDYEEQEEEKKGEIDELKNKKERLEKMKEAVNALLENIDDEEKEALLREILEKLNELEENLEEELEEYEKSLEEVIEKRVLSEQKERADKAEENINKLLSEEGLTEEEIASLEELLERAKEIQKEIDERLYQ